MREREREREREKEKPYTGKKRINKCHSQDNAGPKIFLSPRARSAFQRRICKLHERSPEIYEGKSVRESEISKFIGAPRTRPFAMPNGGNDFTMTKRVGERVCIYVYIYALLPRPSAPVYAHGLLRSAAVAVDCD